MKARRLIALGLLLGALMGSRLPASADEKAGSVITGLRSTTLGGYVDSSVGWQTQARNPQGFRGWARTVLIWFRIHAPRSGRLIP